LQRNVITPQGRAALSTVCGSRTDLRQLLKEEPFVYMPPDYDALGGRLVEDLGFKAVYIGGFVTGSSRCTSEPLLTVEGVADAIPLRIFVTDGCLISYGPGTTDLYPRVAGYIDRLLKGEKPPDLPVQFSTKSEIATSTLGQAVGQAMVRSNPNGATAE
jgi:hypothetical protein